MRSTGVACTEDSGTDIAIVASIGTAYCMATPTPRSPTNGPERWHKVIADFSQQYFSTTAPSSQEPRDRGNGQ
jgi:hypothetical protein